MLEKYLSDFESLFQDAADKLYSIMDDELAPAIEHFREVSSYNVIGGKNMRGLLCVAAFDAFSSMERNPFLMRTANLLGWCIEFMQSGFLVLDDLMDNSSVRRGKTSWNQLQFDKGRGFIAANDGLHLLLSSQEFLFILFKDKPEFQSTLHELFKLFSETMFMTCSGQSMDMLTCIQNDHHNNFRLNSFTPLRWMSISKYKTSFYSFYLPVASGLLLAGIKSERLFKDAKTILFKIGLFFQAQDDFLDVYGDSNLSGKVGTDIVEGKCSWVIVTALSKASEEQRQALIDNYGIPDNVCVDAVKQIFTELNLPHLFEEYSNQTYSEIIKLIDELCSSTEIHSPGVTLQRLPARFFKDLLNFINKRKK